MRNMLRQPMVAAGVALGVLVVMYILAPARAARRTGLERLAATGGLDTSGWQPIRMHSVSAAEIDAEPALLAAQPRLQLAVEEVRRASRRAPAISRPLPLPPINEAPTDSEDRQGGASWLMGDVAEQGRDEVAFGRGGWLAEGVRDLKVSEEEEQAFRFTLPDESVFGQEQPDEGLFDAYRQPLFQLGGDTVYGEEDTAEERIFGVPQMRDEEREAGLGGNRGLFAPESSLR